MYAWFPPFFGQPGPSCGTRRSGFFACPAPDTAVPVRTRRRVRTRARGHGRGRGGALANQDGPAACLLCRGRKGYARGRDGLLANRDGLAASRSGVTRARVCRIKRVSVCPAAGRAVGCRYGCRPARKRGSGRMPGRLRPACREMWVLSPEPRRRLAGKERLLRVRALCRACPQK